MRQLLLLLPFCIGESTRPAPTTDFIGSGDAGKSQFDLLFVSLNAGALTVDTTLLFSLPGWVMVQGDATAFDPATSTYYATLNDASKPGCVLPTPVAPSTHVIVLPTPVAPSAYPCHRGAVAFWCLPCRAPTYAPARNQCTRALALQRGLLTPKMCVHFL